MGLEPTHVPFTQASLCVHALPSEQAVPFGAFGFEHTPVLGLHVPASEHCPADVQTTGFDPTHVPLLQASLCVQAFPSLHEVPFGAVGFEHTPFDGLQVPAAWHWSDAPQTTGSDPTQTPLSHASTCVQALPSVHAVPFAAVGFEHTPLDGSHVPAT
jgi:hypothetical protein